MASPKQFQYLINKDGRTAQNTLLLAHPLPKSGPRALIVWSQSNTHYYMFDRVSEFVKWLLTKPADERTFSEVIFGNEPQKLKLDIDGATSAQLKTVFDAIQKVWKDIPTTSGTDHMYIFKTGEMDHHIVIDHVVESVERAEEFANKVRDATGDPTMSKIIDPKVYNNTQNFRIMGCSKGPGLPTKVPVNTKKIRMIDSLVGVNYVK